MQHHLHFWGTINGHIINDSVQHLLLHRRFDGLFPMSKHSSLNECTLAEIVKTYVSVTSCGAPSGQPRAGK